MEINEFHLKIAKILNIVQFQTRIIQIIRILEFPAGIKKIMKVLQFHKRETRKSLKFIIIPFENHKNHENY